MKVLAFNVILCVTLDERFYNFAGNLSKDEWK